MGIYGHTAHMIMEAQNMSNNSYNINSIIYDEYENRKSLLENCIDDNDKVVLEAQVQVLCEVAIKDIIEKVKEAFGKLKKFVKDIWEAIIRKIKEIRDKIKEIISKKKKYNTKEKDLEHDDRIKQLIDESTVAQYKIGDIIKYAGDFSKEYNFSDIAFKVKDLTYSFNFTNTDDILENDPDLENNKDYNELKEIKEQIKEVKIEYVPVTQYKGSNNKHIQSSDNINQLLNLLDMYCDIIIDMDTDLNSIENSKKYINSAMDSIQRSIDYWEKELENNERRSSEASNDFVKDFNARLAESSRKYASIYIKFMTIIKEIDNDYFTITGTIGAAVTSMENQRQKIDNFLTKYTQS